MAVIDDRQITTPTKYRALGGYALYGLLLPDEIHPLLQIERKQETLLTLIRSDSLRDIPSERRIPSNNLVKLSSDQGESMRFVITDSMKFLPQVSIL